MKKEFVTLYGKAIIERDILYFKSMYLPFSKTAFARIGFEFAFIILFLLQFFRDPGFKMYVGILMCGILFLFRIPILFDVLFKRSYASRIPLQKIKSVTIIDDNFGLLILATLHLTNGRYKKIAFRKLENQYEPFAEFISQFITQAQPI